METLFLYKQDYPHYLQNNVTIHMAVNGVTTNFPLRNLINISIIYKRVFLSVGTG